MGCLDDAIATGAVDKETEAEIREAYGDAFEAAGATLAPAEADRHAGKVAMSTLERKVLEGKRHKALAVRARRAALESAAAFKTARGYTDVKPMGAGQGGRPPKGGWSQGGRPPAKGPWSRGGVMADWLKELVDGEGGLAGAEGVSIKGRYQALAGDFQAKMASLMDSFEEVAGLGVRGRATLDNLVDEAFGGETGDAAARALASSWAGAHEYARKLFNAAGGSIPKLEKWGLPQAHDALAIRAAGREAWVEATLPLLDRAKMIDRVTEQPFTDKRLKVVLGEAWASIVSGGTVDREVGDSLGVGKLANQRQDHRFMIFADGKAWRAYQARFGHGDPYVAMMRHMDSMARDIARMQVLGPNPDHQFDWLKKVALKEAGDEVAAGTPKAQGLKQPEGDADSAEKMYRLFTGELAAPYGGADNQLARVGAAARAGLSAVQLGSAVINDVVSNPVFAGQVRSFIGLSKAGEFRPWLEHVVTATGRQTARRSGFILESARVRHAEAVQRFLRAETVGAKIYEGANAFARMLPSWVHRASFLESNRNAQRWAFQHEFMGRLADLRDRDLESLAGSTDESERAFAAIVKARGFTAAEWDQVRSVAPESPEEGVDFLSPQAVGKVDPELGWRVAEMIERETRQAVPEPSLWAQAQLLNGSRPGTVQGELVRSVAAYRSFTVTQTYRWSREFMQRGLEASEAGGAPWHLRAAGLAAPLLATATLTGFLAIWLKDIAKGNDPRPLWDEDPEKAWPRLWKVTAQAMAQGGGQGILGDFFSSVEARNGKGAALTGMGAPAGLVSDLWSLTGGNVGELLDGKDTHAGREATKFLARYSPLSSLWWSRAAWDRAVADQLQRVVDPDAEGEFRRTARRLERDYGQGQWWPEGQATPARAPDVAAVVGQ